MRPLRLDIENFRSYRGKVPIDFTGRGLVAIVGDTGAGKSSILEALCFALYGQPSFSRETRELIPDELRPSEDGDTPASPERMTVALEFEASGATWSVVRTVAAGSSPPPEHRLQLVDDPAGHYPDFETVTGKRAVDERAERLVGLDFATFRSSVLLPQGRFSDLLYEKPAKRTATLKSLFGLDALEVIREREKERASQASTAKNSTLLDRASLGYDAPSLTSESPDTSKESGKSPEDGSSVYSRSGPREAARAARREEGDARLRKETLETASDTLSRSREAERECEDKSRAHREAREVVRAAIEDLEGKGNRVDELEANLSSARQREENLGEAAERAEESSSQKKHARDEHRRTYGSRNDLESARSKLSNLNSSLSGGLEFYRESQYAEREAEKKTEEARRLSEEYASAAAEESEASTAREDLEELVGDPLRKLSETDFDSLARHVADSLGESVRADYEAEQAQEIYTARFHEHARHVLASEIEEGSLCPVCEQEVRDASHVSRAGNKESGEGDAPETDLREANRRASRLAAEHQEAVREMAEALRPLVDSSIDETLAAYGLVKPEKVEQALETYDNTGSLEGINDLSRDPEALSETSYRILDAIRERLSEKRHTAEDARSISHEAHGASSAAEAASESAREASKRARKEADARFDYLSRMAVEAREAADSFAECSEGSPSALQISLEDWGSVSALSESEELQVYADNLHNLVTDRDKLEYEREASAEAAESARKEARDAAAIRAECEEALQAPREAAGTLGKAIQEAGRKTDVYAYEANASDKSDPTSEPGLPNDILGVLEQGRNVETSLKEAEERKEAEAAAEREKRLQTLEENGIPSEEALGEALKEAGAEMLAASRRAEAAEAAIEPYEQLTEQAETEDHEESVHTELAALLTDGRFVGYCVKRRQQELLALSSDMLLQMTGNRYGFAEDFRVVDLDTDTAREGRTLSGGETFLASLALALGLVELTKRKGSRLDAFFLDEGFGTLDEEALESALDALEEKADSSGSLICLISHVPAVAERIDNVLDVSSTSQGSDAKWRDTGESGDVDIGLPEDPPYAHTAGESPDKDESAEEARGGTTRLVEDSPEKEGADGGLADFLEREGKLL